ncbi:MAG: YfhO family protein [Candidatus Obscuribacterales bacterium]|nr:YfhO family protein [Candidatus Obscuribacterales bacterium]
MAAGVYTPFAPFIVKLSPLFAAFRYPVKLMFFPCMLLILLAVRGIDLIMQDRLSMRMIKAVTLAWGLVFAIGLILTFVPQVGLIASKWPWLFTGHVSESIIKESQSMMGRSVIQAALLGLSACVCAFLASTKKISAKHCAIIITLMMSAALIQSSITYRQLTTGGFYEKPSLLAQRIECYRKQAANQESLSVYEVDSSPKIEKAVEMPSGKEVISQRILNLYFDPLTVPPGYRAGNHSNIDENFFAYSRDMLLYNSVQCWHLPASFAYEAAETGDYKSCFTEAFSKCSQAKREKTSKPEKISDAPVHRFAVLTATDYANTQVYRQDLSHFLPVLDSKYFQLVEESKKLNYRIYRVKHSRPRFYFTDKLVFVDKFKEFQSILCSSEDSQACRALDEASDISYVLKHDFDKHKKEFDEINSSILQAATLTSGAEKIDAIEQISQTKPTATEDRCELISDNGQKTTLKLIASGPKLLVIADHFYPGWEANLDGKEVEIFKTNIVNRGILIPAGTHELTMEFKPRSLLVGCVGAASALVLFLLAYWLFQKFDKSRKQEVSSTSNIQTA